MTFRLSDFKTHDPHDSKLPIHQQSIWPFLNPASARQRYIRAVSDDGTISCLIRFRSVGLGLGFASVQRGPMTPTAEQLADVMPELEADLKTRGAVTLSVNPYWLGSAAAEAETVLTRLGYHRVRRDLQNFHTLTISIPLARSEDEIYAGFSRSGRRELRYAWKAGVETRPMRSRDEAETANQIMALMSAETGMLTDSQHDFRAHFEYLSKAPNAGVILVSTLGDHMLGACVSYAEGARGYNFALTTRRDLGVPRSYDLIWHSALALRKLGCTSFDLAGFPDRNDPATDKSALGRAKFKARLASDIQPVVPVMVKALRPGIHSIVQHGRAVSRKLRQRKVKG